MFCAIKFVVISNLILSIVCLNKMHLPTEGLFLEHQRNTKINQMQSTKKSAIGVTTLAMAALVQCPWLQYPTIPSTHPLKFEKGCLKVLLQIKSCLVLYLSI